MKNQNYKAPEGKQENIFMTLKKGKELPVCDIKKTDHKVKT